MSKFIKQVFFSDTLQVGFYTRPRSPFLHVDLTRFNIIKDGKRVGRTSTGRKIDDFAGAESDLKEVLYSQNKPVPGAVGTPADLVRAYLNYSKINKSIHAHIRDTYVLEKLFLPFLAYKGVTKLSEVDGEIMEDYKPFRMSHPRIITKKGADGQIQTREKPITKATVRREFGILRNMFNKAVQWKRFKLPENPMRYVKSPRVVKTEKVYYSLEQLKTIVAGSLEHHRAIWRFIYFCFLRPPGEALRALKDDIRLVKLPTGEVVRALKTEQHKGNDGEVRIKWVPLSQEAERAIVELISMHDPSDPHIMPRYQGSTLSMAFKRVVRKVGYGGSLYSLRHSSATHVIENGSDLGQAQHLLGHASILTTQDYAHTTDARRVQASRALQPIG